MTRLSASATIATAPDRLFPLLRETRTWANWMPAVVHARTHDLRPAQEGSTLELTFAWGPLRLGAQGRVHICSEGRGFGWRAKVAGVPTTWTWFLRPTERGTRIDAAIDLGLPSWLARWTRLHGVWTRSCERSLRALREMGETL